VNGERDLRKYLKVASFLLSEQICFVVPLRRKPSGFFDGPRSGALCFPRNHQRIRSMDRCAIFVDAGYLLAAGGTLCCSTKVRAGFTCDYAALTKALEDYAIDHSSGMSVLRTYWYDGARNAVPTADHLKIGELPNVKLRLGRISGGEQKGVDSLIVRDLMTLSRERAMADAYLVAGDEDLREGVVAAQDMGVRVVVIGIPGTEENQARTLIRESDEHLVIPKDFWGKYFQKIEVAPAATGAASPEMAKQVGIEFGSQWAERATPEELRGLLGQSPRIPKELDLQLIHSVEAKLGGLWDHPNLKQDARSGFWRAVAQSEAKLKAT
jgi:hypothetical protein